MTGISQYISTIYSPELVRLTHDIRRALVQYFMEEIHDSLATLYERYAVDIVLNNPKDEHGLWKFTVIEVNPFFELTGECLFESEEGRKILNGEAELEYPVMRVQELNTADGTEKEFRDARRQVEQDLSVTSI